MKLTNPESIQESEKEFIDTINAELDWDAIERLLLEKHGFAVQEEISYKDGNLIVHDNQIAYKFDFEIKVPLSVIFNRDGECLEISTRHQDDSQQEEAAPDDESEMIETRPRDRGSVGEMASEIADMISEINQ